MNKSNDIVELVNKTGLSITVCREAYEANGSDVEKAKAYLLTTYATTIENKALKRKKRDTVVYFVASIFFFIMGIVGIVLTIIDIKSVDIPIMAFILFLVSFIAYCVYRDMTIEEYKKAATPTCKYVYNDGVCVVKCPDCGSTHITYNPKKFSKTKALFGMALTGRMYGVLFGIPTSNECKAYCEDCGYRFTVIDK